MSTEPAEKKIGSGGPSDDDNRDHSLMANHPELHSVYFDGHGAYRIGKAHFAQQMCEKVEDVIQILHRHHGHLKDLELRLAEMEKVWRKPGGVKRVRGQSPGKPKKTATS